MYSKLRKKQNIRKVAESLYKFLTATDEAEKYVEIMQSNFSDNYVHHYNVENYSWSTINLWLKTNQKLKKFIVQKTLVLEHKKQNDLKTFHSNV